MAEYQEQALDDGEDCLGLVSAMRLIIVMIVVQVGVCIRTSSRILMILTQDCSFTICAVLLSFLIHLSS
jgi:hypothetical protein